MNAEETALNNDNITLTGCQCIGFFHKPDSLAILKSGVKWNAVWRVLKKAGIYRHRLRSWCVSTDPEFTEKSANIIGLYMNPPLHALVISVDEKPSIQILERTTDLLKPEIKPLLPL